MGYNLLINGRYWGYNLLTNLLVNSWDIQVLVLRINGLYESPGSPWPPFLSPVGFRVSPFILVGVKIIFQKEPHHFLNGG